MRRPSPALVISLLALFVALGGVGVAATGGSFVLGQTNTADHTSSLVVSSLPAASTCHAPCPALQIADRSTAANAGGLSLLTRSTLTPAARTQNTGGATALSLLVNSGKPPLRATPA